MVGLSQLLPSCSPLLQVTVAYDCIFALIKNTAQKGISMQLLKAMHAQQSEDSLGTKKWKNDGLLAHWCSSGNKYWTLKSWEQIWREGVLYSNFPIHCFVPLKYMRVVSQKESSTCLHIFKKGKVCLHQCALMPDAIHGSLWEALKHQPSRSHLYVEMQVCSEKWNFDQW